MNPTVSVVMSVYNGEKHLCESVDSILNQIFKDFEFIIINDGSTDRTKDILGSYAAKDDRIVLIHQEKMGLTKSLNRGISIVKGKYIARQDADDLSKLERLERQVAFMEANPSVGLISSWYEVIDERGNFVRENWAIPVGDDRIGERLIEINQFCHGAAMIRKKTLDTVGMYREFFEYAQDYDLWLRISEKFGVGNLPVFLLQYRESDDGISSNKILIQSRYAGVAREMALQRRAVGTDDIESGIVPKLTKTRHLSDEVKKKLKDFYKTARNEALRKGEYWQYVKNALMYFRMKRSAS
jgi:glycosyltransferase involved in cell wall biosynthesis